MGILIVVLACLGLSLSPLRIRLNGWKLELVQSIRPAVVSIRTETSTLPSPPFATETAPASQSQEACCFVEPILAAIIDRPPDFVDDFSTDTGWINGISDQSGLDRIVIEDGQLRIVVGGPRNATQVTNPQVAARNFVLSVDVSIEGHGEFDRGQIDWATQKNRANLLSVSTNQVWEARACDRTGCNSIYATGGSGAIVPGRPFRVIVVAWDHQFALYLNGHFLTHIDDPIRQSGMPDINLSGYSDAPTRTTVITFDNLKFWNLDNLALLP